MQVEIPVYQGNFHLREAPQKLTTVQEDGQERFAPSSNLAQLIPKRSLCR